MRKRYFIAVIASLLLAAPPSFVHAAPYPDADISIWSRFWQWEIPWGQYEKYLYAGVKITDSSGKVTGKWMSKNGCLVTTLSMLLNYYGALHIPDENYLPKLNPLCLQPGYSWYCDSWGLYIRNNPGTLNNWFVEKRLFIKKGADDELYWPTALKAFYVRYPGYWSWTVAVHPQDSCKPISNEKNCAQVGWSAKAERLLDYDLNQHNLAIMKLKWWESNGKQHDSHFALIAGYDEESQSYRAYDPNQYYDRERRYPPSLKKLYAKNPDDNNDKKDYQELRVDRVKDVSVSSPNRPNLSGLASYLLSPIEIKITGPDGSTIGYDPATGEKIANIPRAYYTEESESSVDRNEAPADPAKILFINEPSPGNYIFKITGTGSGPYTIIFRGTKEDGTLNLDTSITGTATTSLSETYRVTYSPTGEASLSQTNQTPVANAGPDQTGEQSYEITLDGSASSDPDGDPLKYTWSFISRPPNSAGALSNSATAKPTFTPDLPGTYVLQLVVNDYFTDSEASTVTVTATPVKSRISVTPNFSSPLNEGSGIISFDVNNIGRIGVSSGVINLSLTDPDGIVVSSVSQAFSLALGSSTTVNVPVSTPPLKFGNYTLTYSQSDETRTGSQTTSTIPNTVLASFSFDKITYRVRETANLTLNLANTGKFRLDNMSVTVTVPDAGYSQTRTASLVSGELAENFGFLLPSSITAGQHNVNVSFGLPSGSTNVQSVKFAIPESSLILQYSGPTALQAGDSVNVTVENTGGVDTNYQTEKLYVSSGGGVVIYQGNAYGSILAREQKQFSAARIPLEAMNGPALMYIQVKDTATENKVSLSRSFQISGSSASLQTRTGKDVYLKTELITGISTISTAETAIENGSLRLRVIRPQIGTGRAVYSLSSSARVVAF